MIRDRLAIAGVCLAASCLAAVLLAACGGSPKVRFYTLANPAPVGADPSGGAAVLHRITVGPVSLPDMVDRPQLVVRTGPNRVALVEQHRWAEPLKSEVPQVIADNLTRQLGGAWVAAAPQYADRDADYRVSVDIQRFDSTLGAEVAIDALWIVRRASGNDAQTGRSSVREPAGDDSYDALVAAHGRALAAISRDIAEAIRAMASGR